MNPTIATAFQEMVEQLQVIYDSGEAEIIAEWVFEYIFNLSKSQIFLSSNQLINDQQLAKLKSYQEELVAHRPVQYVLGESYFYGLKLKVNESVLIPRPETEELVDWCLKEINNSFKQDDLRILDIGTGSGCIALALKSKLKNAKITAIDNSIKALELAKENAEKTGYDISFQQVDILNEAEYKQLATFDIIISNPPYITIEEKENIATHVLNYEPHNALFVTDGDPLQFYKSIAAFSKTHLKEKGKLFLELHADFAIKTKDFLLNNHWKTNLSKDLQGRDRMVMCNI